MKFQVATDEIKDTLENNGIKHIHVARELEYTPLQWSRVLNGWRRFVNRRIARGKHAGKSRAARLAEILGEDVSADDVLKLLGCRES